MKGVMRGRGSSSARRGRGANSRPCFTNCHLKGTNRGTAAAAREGSSGSRRWIAQGCTHLAAVASRLRGPTHKKKNKTSGISFDTGAGSNKCGAMGTSKAPPPIDAYLEIGPVSVVYLASNPCVCRKKRKTTLQGVVYIKVLA